MSDTAPPNAIKAGGAYVEFFTVDGKFHQGLKKAENSLSDFSAKATKAGAALAAAGAAIVTGVLAAAKSFADAGDALDKMSGRTGVAVESLSALSYAAGLSGANIEAVEAAFKGMSAAFLNAQRGSAEVVQAFEGVGLSVAKLATMNPEQKFLAIADALSKVHDPTRRGALAMKLFGEAGLKLLPMLAGGVDGIRAMMKEAGDLGQVMSTEDSKAAAVLTDEIGRLTGSLEALKNTLGAAVAGELTEFIQGVNAATPALIESLKANQEWIVWLSKMALELTAVGAAMGTAGTAAYALSVAIKTLQTATVGLTASLGLIGGAGIIAGLVLITDELTQQITLQSRLNKELKRSIDLRQQLADTAGNLTEDAIEDSRKSGGEDRREKIQTDIDNTQKNIDTKTKRVADLQARADELDRKATIAEQAGSGDEDDFRSQAHAAQLRKQAKAIRNGDLADEQSILKTQQEALQKFKDEMQAFLKEQTEIQKANAGPITTSGQSQSGLTYDPETTKDFGKLNTMGDALQDAANRQREQAAALKKALEEEAEDVAEAMMTPAEKLQKRLERLKQLQGHGLSEQDYNRAVNFEKAQAAIQSARLSIPEMAVRAQNAAAAQQGSQEAFSSIVQAMNNGKNLDQQIASNTKSVADNSKDQARYLKQIDRNIKRIEPVTIKVMEIV